MADDLTNCPHPDFYAHVSVNRMEDSGRFSADGQSLVPGLRGTIPLPRRSRGRQLGAPRRVHRRLELRCPIEPQGEKQLLARNVYQMPPEAR